MANVQDQIRQEIAANDVVLFMKGTPDFPMCGFSSQVVQILGYLGVPYKGINVLEDRRYSPRHQGICELADDPPTLCEGRVRPGAATSCVRCFNRVSLPTI